MFTKTSVGPGVRRIGDAFICAGAVSVRTLGRTEMPGDYPRFDPDFEGVARAPVAQLVAQGHRRIAVSLPDSDPTPGHHYHHGFLAGHGITPDPALAIRVESSENGGMALGDWLLARVDCRSAVLLCSEIAAIGSCASPARSPLRPGKEQSVIAIREAEADARPPRRR